MDRYSEVIGLPVLCVDTGKRIGIIEDVIFCPRHKEVKGFVLERKGCQVSKKVILLKDILTLGPDALVVNDCTCVTNAKKAKEQDVMKDQSKLTGFHIYTRSGEDIGVVKDVLFDYITGHIEGVEVSDGLIQDLVQGRNILPLIGRVEFAEENILVDKEAIEEMTSTGGGIKNKLTENK